MILELPIPNQPYGEFNIYRNAEDFVTLSLSLSKSDNRERDLVLKRCGMVSLSLCSVSVYERNFKPKTGILYLVSCIPVNSTDYKVRRETPWR